MGTHIIAAAMTLLTADNYEFDVNKNDLVSHSRTFRDLAEDFHGVLPDEYASDMMHDEAKLFCAAIGHNPVAVESFCHQLSPRQITRFMAVADYYDLSYYVPHLPKIFAKKIRDEAEHKKVMAGVLPRKASYPILRLAIARAVISARGFLSRPIASGPTNSPLVSSIATDLHRPVRHLRFSHDGATVFAVCSDSVIRIYDVDAATIRQELSRYYAEQISDCIPIAQSRVLITSSGQILRLWGIDEMGRYAESGALGGHSMDVVGLSAVPTMPHQVVSATTNGDIALWDVECQKNVLSISTPSIFTSSPAVSPDKQVAVGSQHGELVIADLPSGKIIYDSIVYGLGIVPYFDPLGQLLVTTSEGSLKVFDQAKNSLSTGINFQVPLYSFASTPDGNFYVLRTGRPSLVILKSKTFEHVRAIISSRERPLAVWNEHSRALRIVTNYRANMIAYDIVGRTVAHQLLMRFENCTHEQLMMLSALDRDIESGLPAESFFERAPTLYSYYKELPDDMREELNRFFNFKGPSVRQKVTMAIAELPFISRL